MGQHMPLRTLHYNSSGIFSNTSWFAETKGRPVKSEIISQSSEQPLVTPDISVEGSFDDCQDTVKALFADSQINQTHRLGAVNSISWARILAQIVYYFHSYFSLLRSPDYDPTRDVRFVVPSGNFGDILAGW